MQLKKQAMRVVATLAATALFAGTGQAAENAAGFYLLGSKTAMAGFVPPPGTYLSDLNYFYSGSAGGNAAAGIALRRSGAVLNIDADINIDAQAYVNAPIALWIAPDKILGGNVGFGIMAPFGSKKIDLSIDTINTITLPNGTTISGNSHFGYDEDSFKFGDPVANVLIGWHEGNWHWSLGALVNIPVGPWDNDSITNVSFHHWGLDTTGAVTWLDATKGHEISVAAGVTYNWENPDTDYKTGTEFHLEWAFVQHLSKTFSIGVSGYHYQQLTGDSGSGAKLGDFEGRVTALGPVMMYTFMCGQTPITTQLEYMREFDVENRAEGNVGLLTLTMPLSGAQ